MAATDILLVASDRFIVLPKLISRTSSTTGVVSVHDAGNAGNGTYVFSGIDPATGKVMNDKALAFHHRPRLVAWVTSSPLFVPWQLVQRWMIPVTVGLLHLIVSSLVATFPSTHSKLVFSLDPQWRKYAAAAGTNQ